MIDWKNWKTGAKIGLLYGIIGLGYFLVLFWIMSQPSANSWVSGLTLWAFMIGIVVFLPLFCLGLFTCMIFSSFVPGTATPYFTIATMPFYGVLLGALSGCLFEKLKNSRGIQKRGYILIDWKNWKGGAKIGFIYGMICAIYYIPILVAQYAPGVSNPFFQPYEDISTSLYTGVGIIVFFPLVIAAALITSPFYLQWNIYEIILSFSIIVIIVGTVLGAVFGHLAYLRMAK